MEGNGNVIGEGVEEQEDDVVGCVGGFVIDDIVASGDLVRSVILAAVSRGVSCSSAGELELNP